MLGVAQLADNARGLARRERVAGICLFSVISALAPTIQFGPITAPLKILEPMPINVLSPMVAA